MDSARGYSASYGLLHRTRGHSNDEIIKRTIKDVNGLKLIGDNYRPICEECVLTKITRKYIPRSRLAPQL
jgi:hypothetical protein